MKLFKKAVVILLCVTFVLAVFPAETKAYTPKYERVRVGLYYGSGALQGVNLQNASGYGYGYEIGYYNSNRVFQSLGYNITSTNAISMIVDKNCYYNGSNYFIGSSGSDVIVGCYHIKLPTSYSSYSSAKAAMDKLSYSDMFLRYENDKFYILVGEYTSSAAANSGAASKGISSYTVDSGTSTTIAIVKTGTDDILFEFDCGNNKILAVAAKRDSGGAKCETWSKGYKYNGAFEYYRSTYGSNNGNIVVINNINIEDYTKGVIPYEMSPSWPLEALKAQAVCARTYAANTANWKHDSYEFDICNTSCCQVYRGRNSADTRTDTAVDQTAGKYLTYKGALCGTYYSSSNGGASESAVNVWGSNYGYLIGKIDPYEEKIANIAGNYSWSEVVDGDEMASQIYSNTGVSLATVVDVEMTYTEVGNVLSMKFIDKNGKTATFSRSKVRAVLDVTMSPRFTIVEGNNDLTAYVNSDDNEIDMSSYYAVGSSGTVEAGNTGTIYAQTENGVEKVEFKASELAEGEFLISGTGWGHNVGLSQWGAYSMARYYGKTYDEILKFYYTDVTVG